MEKIKEILEALLEAIGILETPAQSEALKAVHTAVHDQAATIGVNLHPEATPAGGDAAPAAPPAEVTNV